jgi:uncharacterized surface protein with fasciclin (FAS1) repeats
MKTQENVYQVINRDERFTVLQKILDSTGTGEAMTKEREAFTFFAPTDEAFSHLPRQTLRLLTSPEGKGLAAGILGQHLIPKSYLNSKDLRQKASIKNLNGTKLKITEVNNVLHLQGGARVFTPEIAASNGVIFPVDKILPVKPKILSV